MSKDYATITKCRSCGSESLAGLFSLGEQFVSDFVTEDKIHSGIKCPIELVLCPSCTLVQARHTARQDFLYTRHYWYRSGVTDTMRAALRDVVRIAYAAASPKRGDTWIDIGSNDGTLLRSVKAHDESLITIGVEPAKNLAAEGSAGVDYLIKDFWPLNPTALGSRQAKVITALGMMYDLEDPGAFIAGVAKVLHPDGVFVAQLMCLKQMLEQKDIGNLAHEHLEFYSLKSLDLLLGRHGLEIFDLEENAVNGGSYRLFIGHKDKQLKATERLREARVAEACMGLTEGEIGPCISFFQEACKARDKIVTFIESEVAKGKRVWVYGASTKGSVLLQWWWNRSYRYLPFEAAADRSPEKWGKFTIGTGIPIRNEEDFRRASPDYALILPYAFTREFVERERDWLLGGGRFIVPLPEPRYMLLIKESGNVGEAYL